MNALELQKADAQTAWQTAVQNFTLAYAEFNASRQAALAQDKGTQWQALNHRAMTARDTISRVAGPINTLYGWLDRVAGGADGLKMLADFTGFKALPQVPQLLIQSSTGAVFIITAQLNNFNRSLRG